MWIEIVNHKQSPPLQDLLPELRQKFPGVLFSVQGTEGTSYKLILTGVDDEKAPRKFSEAFLKKWKPSIDIIE